jgi:uncharacterized membrane protein YjjP (DUF1212 family)
MLEVMENFRIVILLAASISILFGYFRFISDEKGNVNLNNFRFTGGLGLVIVGMLQGTRDMFSHDFSSNSFSALAIYLGGLLFILGFNI